MAPRTVRDVTCPPAPVVLCDPDESTLLERFGSAVRDRRAVAVLDPSWPSGLRADAERDVAQAARQGLVGSEDLVVFSSGSTGAPRGLIRTAESWRASLDGLTALIRPQPDDVVGIPGPLPSTLFLYGAWHARCSGLPVVLRGQLRAGWDRVSIVHAVPALVAGWTELPPRLRTLVLAGDRVPAGLLERCRTAGVRVVEYYGSAETSFVLAGVQEPGGLPAGLPGQKEPSGLPAEGSAGLPGQKEPSGAAGPGLRPFSGVRVRLDADGRLWSRSPYAFRRYLRGAEGPARFDGGWLSVGDLAATRDGEWILLGRPGTVNTGGHTVQIAAVERALRRIAGVREAVVVAVPHPQLGELVGAVVSGDVDVARLRAAVRTLPGPARPRRWLVTDDLPRCPAGKPDRRRAVALLADRPTGLSGRGGRHGLRPNQEPGTTRS